MTNKSEEEIPTQEKVYNMIGVRVEIMSKGVGGVAMMSSAMLCTFPKERQNV